MVQLVIIIVLKLFSSAKFGDKVSIRRNPARNGYDNWHSVPSAYDVGTLASLRESLQSSVQAYGNVVGSTVELPTRATYSKLQYRTSQVRGPLS